MRKIRWGVMGTADIARGATIPGMQLGRCIAEGETPFVTKEFSLMCARTTDRILGAIGY